MLQQATIKWDSRRSRMQWLLQKKYHWLKWICFESLGEEPYRKREKREGEEQSVGEEKLYVDVGENCCRLFIIKLSSKSIKYKMEAAVGMQKIL